VSRAQIALAWVAQQDVVSAPIGGATRPQHLEDAVAAVQLQLTGEELDRLAQHYVPHAVEGF
jgi:1-deoxyxylulose-5-phosphate synthase